MLKNQQDAIDVLRQAVLDSSGEEASLIEGPIGRITCEVSLAPPAPREGTLQRAWQAPPTYIDLPRDSKVMDLRASISMLCCGAFSPGSVFLDKRSSQSSRNVAQSPLRVDRSLAELQGEPGKPLQLMVQAEPFATSRIWRRANGLLGNGAGPSGAQHGRHASRLPPTDGPACSAPAVATAAARRGPQAKSARKPGTRSESPSVSKGQEQQQQQQQQKQEKQQGRGKKRAPTPPSEPEENGSDDMDDGEQQEQQEQEEDGAEDADPAAGSEGKEGGKQPQRRQPQKPRKKRKRIVPRCLTAPSSAAKRKASLDGAPGSGGPKARKGAQELSGKQGQKGRHEPSADSSGEDEGEGEAEEEEEQQQRASKKRGAGRAKSTRGEKEGDEVEGEAEEEEQEQQQRVSKKGGASRAKFTRGKRKQDEEEGEAGEEEEEEEQRRISKRIRASRAKPTQREEEEKEEEEQHSEDEDEEDEEKEEGSRNGDTGGGSVEESSEDLNTAGQIRGRALFLGSVSGQAAAGTPAQSELQSARAEGQEGRAARQQQQQRRQQPSQRKPQKRRRRVIPRELR